MERPDAWCGSTPVELLQGSRNRYARVGLALIEASLDQLQTLTIWGRPLTTAVRLARPSARIATGSPGSTVIQRSVNDSQTGSSFAIDMLHPLTGDSNPGDPYRQCPGTRRQRASHSPQMGEEA